FGGHADAVMARIACMGDGWMPNYRTAKLAQPALARLDEYLAQNGRSRTDIGIEPRLYFKGGNPDHWQKIMQAWIEEGATHFTFNTMGAGFTSPQQHLAALGQFAKLVL
ncbi:MAG: LLM class F420-dependent oxidoreductase, partial [Anaerolineae bacterium]